MPSNKSDQGEYVIADDAISAEYEEKGHDGEFTTPNIFYLFDKRQSIVVGAKSCSSPGVNSRSVRVGCRTHQQLRLGCRLKHV